MVAKIVYGVAGEGSGHSSRAREIGSYLVTAGHQVKMVSYDRGYRNLSDTFDVFETEGLHISSADNKISVVRTFVDNFSRAHKGHQRFRILKQKLFKDFTPDCVITDFEPMCAYLAHHYDLPLITIDNQHRIRYMTYPCPARLQAERRMTVNIIRAMVPRPDISLVTTFYYGDAKNDRTFFFPPILRREVLSLQPSTAGHILVYLTGGFESFLKILKSFPREKFIVYGYDRQRQDGNLAYKPFSRQGFLKDFASCKAVMATAGFTLITEAFYLRKPYLALPMRGQFEQELNAHWLAKLNYGINLRRIRSEAVGNFLYRVPDYKERLNDYRATDSRAIQAKLAELLDNNCELAKEYHRRRR